MSNVNRLCSAYQPLWQHNMLKALNFNYLKRLIGCPAVSICVCLGENDSEDQNPVKRALRRAELKNKTKSLEDITSFGSSICKEKHFYLHRSFEIFYASNKIISLYFTGQERRPDPIDMRRSKNGFNFD